MTVGEPMIAVFQFLRLRACSRRMVAAEASSEGPIEYSVDAIEGVVRWKVVERECSGGHWVGVSGQGCRQTSLGCESGSFQSEGRTSSFSHKNVYCHNLSKEK